MLVLSWYFARKNLFQKPFFGIITYLSFFCLGAANYQLRSPDYQPNHYTHFLSEENDSRLTLEVLSTQKPNNFSHRFIAEVKSVNSSPTQGKLLVYLQRDSTSKMPSPGQRLTVFAQPQELTAPLNPGQFDYAKYLRSKDIFRQLNIDSEVLLYQHNKQPGFLSRIQSFRNVLLQKLEAYPFGTEELSIVQALTLGHRNSIDKDLYKSYASAGAIHVLAVSGLHVGIIYFILQWLFQPLLFLPKGRKIMVVFVVASLVFYALITGMSPSVTRAVTMFSFFGMSRLINRPTNSINTLFLSFFFLLLWNPKWLFDVGFQLSYTAVFFILWLHPRISALYQPKYFVDKLIWSTITVSFCAQLGVAPLSIYYFNQFPGLFLLSNLVVLPFIGLLVGTGLLLLFLASIDLAPNWLANMVNEVVNFLNRFVVWISEQEHFIFRDLVISEIAVLSSYVLIVSTTLVLSRFGFNQLRVFLIALVFFLLIIFHFETGNASHRLIIFHKNKETIVGIQKQRSLLILKQDSVSPVNNYPIASFRTSIREQFYSEEIIPAVIQFKQSILVVVDSTGVYPKGETVDIVLLSGSPKVNLDLLIENLQPKKIVADGSNYKSYVRRWENTCRNRKLPFHHTGNSGAFILE
ncbi:ComEC family competence protein [Aureitalea sp. L0-47]|nr:ComEC family competence protein [Aureitalea sp. L0-47]